MKYKDIWIFVSVLAAALEESIDETVLHKWREWRMFSYTPFGNNDRYICQGIRQIQFWLEDLNQTPGLMERLHQDYLQMFIGTPKPLAPMWSSCYLEEGGLLFQKKAAEAGDWYRRYHLAVLPQKGMPDDYLIYELYFITVILEAYRNEMKKGNLKQANEHIQDVKKFVLEQMMTWIPQWREDVMLYSRTEYYRGLSNMIYGMVCILANLEVEGQK